MNFLVTGGAGFIGSHVCERLLRDGHSVWAFDDLNNHYDPQLKRRNLREVQAVAGGCAVPAAHRRRGSAAATKSEHCRPFEFVHGDITDRAALDEVFSSVKFDQVIHLAARAGVRPSLADPALYQRVNVEGTVNVLEAARTHRVKKIIIASSSSVYGMNAKTPFSESDPIFSAVSPYAASKLACEALGHVWHHIYGMDVAVLRFFTVYGPRQRPDLVIYKFAKLISAGKPIPVFGDGSAARDYTFITDTLDGIIACTQKEFGYELFNLGESQTVKLDYLIELLQKSLGKKAVIDRQPVQPGDVPITVADISKARAKLGYNPRVKIEQGIPKFVDWFLKSNG
jgi:UDP-glucuronate 4-epimerase